MGTRIMVEMDWEQVDEIICSELRDHVLILHKEMTEGDYIHPSDKIDNETLIPALLRVYEYWAGESELEKLKQEIGYETETD